MSPSDPVLTQTFRLLTAATPERVWRVLTCADAAPSYLHGLSPRTCWSEGAPVSWHGPSPAIPGQVLRADPPHRLSVTVEDESGTCTYLTWSLRACEAGTVIRLDIAETDAASSSDADLEELWLPVLQRLGDVLREPVS